MNILKPFWGFARSFLLGQARIYLAMGATYLEAHGMAAGYSQDQLLGAGMAVAAVALQAFDTFFVDKKIASALNTNPAVPAVTVTGQVAPPLTMKPIPN